MATHEATSEYAPAGMRDAGNPAAPGRRNFLTALGAGALSLGVGGASTGCKCSNRRPGGGSVTSAAQTRAVVPAYYPMELLEPDFPAEERLAAGFVTFPKQPFVRVIEEKPGRGGPEIKTMTPQWGPAPPGVGRNQYVDAINRELGVIVNPGVQDGMNYGQKLSAILGARDVPDVLCVPGWEVDKIPRFSQAVKALFADLTPFLKGEAVKKYRMLATLPTETWQHCVWNGRLSAIPFPKDKPFPWTMFYRKDITDAAGTPLPDTLDELLRFGKTFTKPNKGVWAFANNFDMIQMYFRCPHSRGGWRERAGGGLEFKYETREYRAALEFTKRLYDEGMVHPDLVASKGADAKQLFQSGRVIMMQDGMGVWMPMQRNQRQIEPTFNMQPLPVFAADGGTPVSWGDGGPVFYTFVKEGLGTERTEEILRVLDWCAAPFGSKEYELNVYGVEGKHFKRAPDHSPIPTKLGQKEMAGQFQFISGRVPVTVGSADLPHHVEDEMAYCRETVKYLEPDLFEGIKLELPPTYSKTIIITEDKISDVLKGKRPLSDFDQIVEEWRRSGGDDGRRFFEKALEQSA